MSVTDGEVGTNGESINKSIWSYILMWIYFINKLTSFTAFLKVTDLLRYDSYIIKSIYSK